MKYEIIRRDSADELISAVNSYMNPGWEPVGGVTLSVDRDRWENERKGCSESSVDIIWAQAIVMRGV